MKLMKGTGRGDVSGNDIELIFATTERRTAEKYANWRNAGRIAHFDVDVDGVANLNDQNTAAKIVDRIAETDTYYADNRNALIDELVNGGENEIGIMDDGDFRQAVYDLGYTGAAQDGHYALFNGMVSITEIEYE